MSTDAMPTELEQAVLFLLDMGEYHLTEGDDSETAHALSVKLLNAIRLRQKLQVDNGHSSPARLV